jgi:hypothetical protein
MSRPSSHHRSVRADLAHAPTLAGGLPVALAAAVWVGFALLRGLYAGPGMEPGTALGFLYLGTDRDLGPVVATRVAAAALHPL